MSLSLEDAANLGESEEDFGPCVGCRTWHLWSCLKRSGGFFWCVLCYPSPMEEER